MIASSTRQSMVSLRWSRSKGCRQGDRKKGKLEDQEADLEIQGVVQRSKRPAKRRKDSSTMWGSLHSLSRRSSSWATISLWHRRCLIWRDAEWHLKTSIYGCMWRNLELATIRGISFGNKGMNAHYGGRWRRYLRLGIGRGSTCVIFPMRISRESGVMSDSIRTNRAIATSRALDLMSGRWFRSRITNLLRQFLLQHK